MSDVFKAHEGSFLSDEQAALYGPRIVQLAGAKDKTLQPRELVADAKDPESPLHEYFEWDDKEAAIRFRDTQAQYLLRAIDFVIDHGKPTERRMPLTRNIVIEQERGYQTIGTILREPDLHRQIIDQAMGKLLAWTKIHASYEALGDVVEKVTAIIDEYA
jgi:hypothetical protein